MVSIYLTCVFLKAFTKATPHRPTTPPLPFSFISVTFLPLSYCRTFQMVSLRGLELLIASFSTVSQSILKPHRLWWMSSNAFIFYNSKWNLATVNCWDECFSGQASWFQIYYAQEAPSHAHDCLLQADMPGSNHWCCCSWHCCNHPAKRLLKLATQGSCVALTSTGSINSLFDSRQSHLLWVPLGQLFSSIWWT